MMMLPSNQPLQCDTEAVKINALQCTAPCQIRATLHTLYMYIYRLCMQAAGSYFSKRYLCRQCDLAPNAVPKSMMHFAKRLYLR
jgi:hypothetical protein